MGQVARPDGDRCAGFDNAGRRQNLFDARMDGSETRRNAPPVKGALQRLGAAGHRKLNGHEAFDIEGN